MKTTFSGDRGIRMRGAPSPDSRIKGGADGETKMADKYAARHLFPDDAVTWKKVYVPSSPHYLVQLRFSFGSRNYFLHFLSYIERICRIILKERNRSRSRQDSNLRGESP